ncbi:hypothetical protein JCM9279_002281 [Rhodotorula babjevae]
MAVASSTSAPPVPLRIVVVGDGGVGKSSLTMAILQRPFSEEYDPTVEDAYSTSVTVDGVDYLVELIDTAGQEEYRYALDQTAQTGDGFILAYSIDSADSFELLPDLLHTLRKAKSPLDNPSAVLSPENAPSSPFLVLGNKCDKPPAERRVTAQEGLAFSRQAGGLFFETSAKSRVNVEPAFLALVRATAQAKRGEGRRGAAGGGGGAAGLLGALSPRSSAAGGVRYGQGEKGSGPGFPRAPTRPRDPSLAMDRRRSLSVGGLGRDPSTLHDPPSKGCGCVVS